jgi:ZIP family zinc transporter
METQLGVLSPLLAGVLASFMASLGTGLGALPVLSIRRVSQRTQDVMLSAAAGIMLAAAAFSLIEPALVEAAQRVGSRPLGTVFLGLSLLAGVGAILAVHRYVPH